MPFAWKLAKGLLVLIVVMGILALWSRSGRDDDGEVLRHETPFDVEFDSNDSASPRFK